MIVIEGFQLRFLYSDTKNRILQMLFPAFSSSHFENADQILKYVILRRPTSKLLFRTQQPADEESHVSKRLSLFFCRFSSKLIFSDDSYRRFFGRHDSIPLLVKHFLFHHQATVVMESCSLRMTGM
jgi:hypothetical protein